MTTLSFSLTWEMGHRVAGSPTCGMLHGHTYKAEIHLAIAPGSEQLPVDVRQVEQWVKANWDGRTLLEEDDPLLGELKRVHLGDLDMIGVAEFHQPPTRINVARELAAKTAELLCRVDHVQIDGVVLLEGECGSSCHVTPGESTTFNQ